MKTKHITLLGQDIEYALTKRARAKNVHVTVHADGRVQATLPRGVSEQVLDAFLQEKANWLVRELERVRERPGGQTSRHEYLQYKERARELIRERVENFNATYNFSYKQIRIKDQKTRWGSCSSKKNLNFSYKLLFLPDRVRDYVIVHELCHLQELNHSQKFWRLVALALPDYKDLREELKRYQLS